VAAAGLALARAVLALTQVAPVAQHVEPGPVVAHAGIVHTRAHVTTHRLTVVFWAAAVARAHTDACNIVNNYVL